MILRSGEENLHQPDARWDAQNGIVFPSPTAGRIMWIRDVYEHPQWGPSAELVVWPPAPLMGMFQYDKLMLKQCGWRISARTDFGSLQDVERFDGREYGFFTCVRSAMSDLASISPLPSHASTTVTAELGFIPDGSTYLDVSVEHQGKAGKRMPFTIRVPLPLRSSCGADDRAQAARAILGGLAADLRPRYLLDWRDDGDRARVTLLAESQGNSLSEWRIPLDPNCIVLGNASPPGPLWSGPQWDSRSPVWVVSEPQADETSLPDFLWQIQQLVGDGSVWPPCPVHRNHSLRGEEEGWFCRVDHPRWFRWRFGEIRQDA